MKHTVPLPGTTWSLWRQGMLRGSGFDAALVLRLAAPAAADDVDTWRAATAAEAAAEDDVRAAVASTPGRNGAVLVALRKRKVPAPAGEPAVDEAVARLLASREASARAEATATRSFARAAEEASAATSELATHPLLREAIAWQNPGVVRLVLDALAKGPRTANNARRKKEIALASYLQRYCTKNDTIGFFGPFGTLTLREDGPPLAVALGSELVRARDVSFEQWGVDAIAQAIALDPRLAPSLPPRRYPFVFVDGERVSSLLTGKATVTAAESALLARCDGVRSAEEIAGELVTAGTYPDDGAVFAALRSFVERKLVSWTLELPLAFAPDEELRRRLAAVTDGDARDRALAIVDELDRARRAVRASSGDPERLIVAIDELDATFTRLTGRPPSRHEGSTYGARRLVFEDCLRDTDATMGPALLAENAGALALVFRCARWFSTELALAYGRDFEKATRDLAARKQTNELPFTDVWPRLQRLVYGGEAKPVTAVVARLQAIWGEIFAHEPATRRLERRSSDLAARFETAFPLRSTDWIGSRCVCPDLMIAASGIEAIGRGDYRLVLGEVHVGMNTLDSSAFVARHPDPEALRGAMRAYFPDGRIYVAPSKDWPKITVRTTHGAILENDVFLETSFDPAPAGRARAVRISDLVVDVGDGPPTIRARDGSRRWTTTDLLATFLGFVAGTSFAPVADAAHCPRLTIDRVVVARESWTLPVDEATFASEERGLATFAAVRAWAAARGMPRFVFVKASHETKPFFVDFASPLLVDTFVRAVRRLGEHAAGARWLRVTEMIPDLESLWLPGSKGERYTSEIRVVAFADADA